MIIPIAFEISKHLVLEEFVVGLARETIAASPPADVRVTVKLFDTETRLGLGFNARLIPDVEAPPSHELATLYKMGGELPADRLEYLRELRRAIDDELQREEDR